MAPTTTPQRRSRRIIQQSQQKASQETRSDVQAVRINPPLPQSVRDQARTNEEERQEDVSGRKRKLSNDEQHDVRCSKKKQNRTPGRQQVKRSECNASPPPIPQQITTVRRRRREMVEDASSSSSSVAKKQRHECNNHLPSAAVLTPTAIQNNELIGNKTTMNTSDNASLSSENKIAHVVAQTAPPRIGTRPLPTTPHDREATAAPTAEPFRPSIRRNLLHSSDEMNYQKPSPDVLPLPNHISQATRQQLLADLGAIAPQYYTIHSILGSGAFGCVFLATEVKTNRRVAIKYLYDTPDTALTSQNELQFLRQFRHLPHVVSLHQSITRTTDKRLMMLVLDYCEGRTLKQEVDRGHLLSDSECRTVLRPILQDLQVMHAANVVYRDMKPENIVVTPTTTTLIDLGLCVHVTPGTTIRSKSGTEGFWAPEVYDENGSPYYAHGYGTQADMYSVGCTLYYLLTGTNYDPQQQKETPQQLDGLSFWARDVVENLTRVNPTARMTVRETLKHPFFHSSVQSVLMAHMRRTYCKLQPMLPYILIGLVFLVSAMFSP